MPSEAARRVAEAIWERIVRTGPAGDESAVEWIRDALEEAVRAERLTCMELVCNRCAGDPRGPGQHEIETCDAAALREEPRQAT